MEVTIVPMRQEHTAQIAALEATCFSDPWPESILQQELENPLSLWLCAMDGDTVAGYVGSQTVLGEADMMNLAVSPAYRRQGLGRALVLALCESLRQKMQATVLTLEVRGLKRACRRALCLARLRADRPAEKLLPTSKKRMHASSERNCYEDPLRGILLRRDCRRRRGGRKNCPDRLHRVSGRPAPALRRRRARSLPRASTSRPSTPWRIRRLTRRT